MGARLEVGEAKSKQLLNIILDIKFGFVTYVRIASNIYPNWTGLSSGYTLDLQSWNTGFEFRRDAVYPNWDFCGFLQDLQENTRPLPWLEQDLFFLHCFRSTLCSLVTVSIVKQFINKFISTFSTLLCKPDISFYLIDKWLGGGETKKKKLETKACDESFDADEGVSTEQDRPWGLEQVSKARKQELQLTGSSSVRTQIH